MPQDRGVEELKLRDAVRALGELALEEEDFICEDNVDIALGAAPPVSVDE